MFVTVYLHVIMHQEPLPEVSPTHIPLKLGNVVLNLQRLWNAASQRCLYLGLHSNWLAKHDACIWVWRDNVLFY